MGGVLGEGTPEVAARHVLGDEHDLVTGHAGAQELHNVDVAQRLEDGHLVAEALLLLWAVPRHKLHRHGGVALPDPLVHLRAGQQRYYPEAHTAARNHSESDDQT